jgi:hypothetical protein
MLFTEAGLGVVALLVFAAVSVALRSPSAQEVKR